MGCIPRPGGLSCVLHAPDSSCTRVRILVRSRAARLHVIRVQVDLDGAMTTDTMLDSTLSARPSRYTARTRSALIARILENQGAAPTRFAARWHQERKSHDCPCCLRNPPRSDPDRRAYRQRPARERPVRPRGAHHRREERHRLSGRGPRRERTHVALARRGSPLRPTSPQGARGPRRMAVQQWSGGHRAQCRGGHPAAGVPSARQAGRTSRRTRLRGVPARRALRTTRKPSTPGPRRSPPSCWPSSSGCGEARWRLPPHSF